MSFCRSVSLAAPSSVFRLVDAVTAVRDELLGFAPVNVYRVRGVGILDAAPPWLVWLPSTSVLQKLREVLLKKPVLASTATVFAASRMRAPSTSTLYRFTLPGQRSVSCGLNMAKYSSSRLSRRLKLLTGALALTKVASVERTLRMISSKASVSSAASSTS